MHTRRLAKMNICAKYHSGIVSVNQSIVDESMPSYIHKIAFQGRGYLDASNVSKRTVLSSPETNALLSPWKVRVSKS